MKKWHQTAIATFTAIACLFAGGTVGFSRDSLPQLQLTAEAAEKQVIDVGTELTVSGTLSYVNGKDRPILNLDTPIEATVSGMEETVTYVRLNEESLSYAEEAKLNVTGTVAMTTFSGNQQFTIFLEDNDITEIPADSILFGKKTYQLNGHTLKVILWGYTGSLFDEVEYLSIYVDNQLSNFDKITVGSVIAGTSDAQEARANVDRYFAISGTNKITITNRSSESVSTTYLYNAESNQFETEQTFTVQVPTSSITAICGRTNQKITESNFKNSMVASSTEITGCTNGTASIIKNGYFVGGFTVTGAKSGTITITGTTGTYSFSDDPNINSSHGECGLVGKPDTFTATVTIDEHGNIVSSEKRFTVTIPYAYFTVIDSVTGAVVTKSGANKSMVHATVTSCSNGNVTTLNEGNEVNNNPDTFLQSITLSDAEPGVVTIQGTCQSYSSLTPEEMKAGYTTLPHCGDAIENNFTVSIIIDEDGNIVKIGDVNSNHLVDVSDAVEVLKYYAKKAAGLNPVFNETAAENNAIFKLADINNDNEITVHDAVLILTYYAKAASGGQPTWEQLTST